MDWVEITIRTNTAGTDMVSEALIQAGSKGTMIEDRNDAEMDMADPSKWDILDPSIIAAMEEDVLVHGYLPADASVRERIDALSRTLSDWTESRLGFDAGKLTLAVANIRDEDWAENWKQYYKPFRVGEHLVIKPVWEVYDAQPGDLVLEMDPGMAFGNGTHETTAMCLSLLEEILQPGDLVLDVGTGSGILALAAAALHASHVTAVDLDPVAVRVANENIERNRMQSVITAQVGDLLAGVDLKANVVIANIIADVIIQLSGAVRQHLQPGGAFLCSGIIREREEDVLSALLESGFSIATIKREGEWVAIVSRS